MAYAVRLSDGQVRIYPSEKAALAHEKRISQGICQGCEVNGAAHWRGRIPKTGVCFGPSDQSYMQLVCAMNNAH